VKIAASTVVHNILY